MTFNRTKRIAACAASVALITTLSPAVAQAQVALPPEVQGSVDQANRAINDARAQVDRAINDARNQAQAALNNTPGSSHIQLPGVAPTPAPAVWHETQPRPVANGQSGAVHIDTRFGPRRFLIHVPANYNPANPVPVLVGIPAYQDTSENFRNYSRLRESTAGREAIIVYPDSWHQSWEAAPTTKSQPGQDIEFIRQVIDRTQASYNIDRGRIYATGMSTGSGMAAVLGCHASDLFAAIAPVSGAYYDAVDMNCQTNPMPILTIHGTNDEQHHYDGGVRYGLHYYGGRELMERYAHRNRCNGARTEHPAGAAVRVVAEGCAASTEHLRVPGGHLWWYKPNTAEEVWAFVSRHRR